MGEMRNNSREGYIERISAELFHVSCLSGLFVLVLCPGAVVPPSGEGRTASAPSGSSGQRGAVPRGGGAIPSASFPLTAALAQG